MEGVSTLRHLGKTIISNSFDLTVFHSKRSVEHCNGLYDKYAHDELYADTHRSSAFIAYSIGVKP